MKKHLTKISCWLIVLSIAQFLFSCNTSIEIAKRHYNGGYYVDIHKKHLNQKQAGSDISGIKSHQSINPKKQNIEPIKSRSDFQDDKSLTIISQPSNNDFSQTVSTDNKSQIIFNNSVYTDKTENLTSESNALSTAKSIMKNKSKSSGGNPLYLLFWITYGFFALLFILFALIVSGTGLASILWVIAIIFSILALIEFFRWLGSL